MILHNRNSLRYVALGFIILYGSGFVGAKIGFPFASPVAFLVVRFCLSTLLLLGCALVLKAKWPTSLMQVVHIVISGLLLLCTFSIGTWVSMDMGVPPATSALIIALQPILVTLISYVVFRQKASLRMWLGLLLGFIGVVLVVIEHAKFDHNYTIGIMMSVLGLIGLSFGSIYQKKYCGVINIWTTGVIQSASAAIVCLIISMIFDIHIHIQWSAQFIFALFWMSIVVSLGAISLLYILILNGESSKVASLFYLVPVVTAVISYFVFGMTLDFLQLFGMLVAAGGVYLVNKAQH